MSLSEGMPTMTMPVAPANGSGNGFGFGGDGAWFLIILFLFAFCGWGGNGWGNSGNSGGVVDGYVLASDFSNIERKMDLINGGLCDGFYAVNNTLLTGFGNAELSRANQQAALMQQLSAMQMQAANCCCENRAAIAQVRYDMATQACDTRNTVQNATRDIVENQNANSRAILDFLTNSKMRDLESANQELRLAASQAAQNNYLISQLRPTPIPAYASCNPWAGSYTGCSGC
ncbi:MAG: hypothetical protein UDO37_06595 [Oscillospiraceae bacterium]|nr:hypothetical protein [Oscillospiraceae bacterium]DAM62480.1 MAG TPA: hypothetical protein [Caudoviricetes sp.]